MFADLILQKKKKKGIVLNDVKLDYVYLSSNRFLNLRVKVVL